MTGWAWLINVAVFLLLGALYRWLIDTGRLKSTTPPWVGYVLFVAGAGLLLTLGGGLLIYALSG